MFVSEYIGAYITCFFLNSLDYILHGLRGVVDKSHNCKHTPTLFFTLLSSFLNCSWMCNETQKLSVKPISRNCFEILFCIKSITPQEILGLLLFMQLIVCMQILICEFKEMWVIWDEGFKSGVCHKA